MTREALRSRGAVATVGDDYYANLKHRPKLVEPEAGDPNGVVSGSYRVVEPQVEASAAPPTGPAQSIAVWSAAMPVLSRNAPRRSARELSPGAFCAEPDAITAAFAVTSAEMPIVFT